MNKPKVFKKEFEKLEGAVLALKRAEAALDQLNVPEEFGPLVVSIRSKLRDPERLPEVESELSALQKQIREQEEALVRLTRAEEELGTLTIPDGLFDAEVESIRTNLKDPSKVDDVERQLNGLRRKIQEHEARQAESPIPPVDAKADGATGPFSPPPPGYAFPRELEGDYCDCSFIGSGGFARVFRAKRRSDGTEVAVKIPERLDAQSGRSFLSEVIAWQRLNHINIVKLYDCNVLPIPYLQMELCQRSLSDVAMPLSTERAAGMMFHIGEGLRHAHSKGIIHRDLKPHNILLQGETPKITDWGLSKVVAESKGPSRSHAQTFSLYWAAPEQVSPKEYGRPDHHTDIWQLGVIFYQLVTGDLPFNGESVTEIMGQILMSEPDQPSAQNPAASAVEPIILKCLQKRMADRYQNVGEIQKALADFLKIEYKDSLARSRGNMTRSAYYCAELCLVHLTKGDIAEALKYAHDLRRYSGNDAKESLSGLVSEMEFRMREGVVPPEELVERAAVILHQAKMGR